MTFSVSLVTAEGSTHHQNVGLVMVPGVEGLYGFLTDHAPCSLALGPGDVTLYAAGATTPHTQVALQAGYALFDNNVCTVVMV